MSAIEVVAVLSLPVWLLVDAVLTSLPDCAAERPQARDRAGPGAPEAWRVKRSGAISAAASWVPGWVWSARPRLRPRAER